MRWKFAALAFVILGALCSLGLPAIAAPQPTQCVTSAIAGGSSDALVIPLLPCGTATNVLILTITQTNTTAAPTLQMPGSAALTIKASTGAALAPGQLAAGSVVYLTGTGTSWLLMSNPVGPTGPQGPQGPAGPAVPPGFTYATQVDVLCSSDLACASLGYITVASVSDNGGTASAGYVWDVSGCGSQPLAQCFVPAGTHTGSFKVRPPLIDGTHLFNAGAKIVPCAGGVDNSALVQSAINEISPQGGGTVTLLSATNCPISQVTLPSNVQLVPLTTIVPLVQPGSVTAAVLTTSSGAGVDCKNIGGFDGISASYNNWAVFQAVGPSAAPAGSPEYISQVGFKNCFVKNVGVGSTGAAPNMAVSFVATDLSEVSGNKFSNVGYTADFTGANQFVGGIWAFANRKLKITRNSFDTVGATGIYDTCGLWDVIDENSVLKVTLFGYKGGYCNNSGTGYIEESNSGNSTSSVVVNNSGYARAVFAVGHKFGVKLLPNNGYYTGYVKDLVIQGDGTLKIVSDTTWGGIPPAGSDVQPVLTGASISKNFGAYSGNNMVDMNGTADVVTDGNEFQWCGLLGGDGDGTHESCIWFGYDPQTGFAQFTQSSFVATNNRLNHAAGSGIVWAAVNGAQKAIITNNVIRDINVDNLVSAGGVYVHPTATASNNLLTGNVVTSTLGKCYFYESADDGSDRKFNNLCATPDANTINQTMSAASMYSSSISTTFDHGLTLAGVTLTGTSVGIGTCQNNTNSRAYAWLYTLNSVVFLAGYNNTDISAVVTSGNPTFNSNIGNIAYTCYYTPILQ